MALAYPDQPEAARWRAEWVALSALGPLEGEWRALAARALQRNVFYEPDFARPAAATLFGSGTGAVLVRGDGVLRGLFPARAEPYRYGVIPGVMAGWTHPYAPLGVPLIDREHADATLGTWLDHLAQTQRLMLLPLVPEDGAFAQALRRALERHGLASAAFGHHRRALLAPGDHRADYLVTAVNAKIRKELARKKRRLADFGEVAHEVATDPLPLRAALVDFLLLELKGWKGRAGTAAAQNAALLHFVEEAVLGLALRGQARIDRLVVADQAVAVTLLLRSGDSAWLWKIAYDEAFARFSPGVQLACDITTALARDSTLAATDACATPDHPMIDHVWRERLALSDLLIALRPGDEATFRLACAFEALRGNARQAAKFIRGRIAGRRAG